MLFAKRHELAAELSRLRRKAGLSGYELAKKLGVSQSKISKMEHARVAIPIEDAKQWAQAVGCSIETVDDITRLADDALTEMVSWRGSRGLSDILPKYQREVGTLEHTATLIREFAPDMVPGLFQTAEYAKRVFAIGYPEGRPDIAPALVTRMERQAILYEEGRQFEFIITEPVLRWCLGPVPMMLAQLDRLRTVATLSNVSIGVVPLERELPVWHSHGFAIYENEEEEIAMVQVETLTVDLNISEKSDIEEFQGVYRRLSEIAVFGEERDELISRIAEDLRNWNK